MKVKLTREVCKVTRFCTNPIMKLINKVAGDCFLSLISSHLQLTIGKQLLNLVRLSGIFRQSQSTEQILSFRHDLNNVNKRCLSGESRCQRQIQMYIHKEVMRIWCYLEQVQRKRILQSSLTIAVNLLLFQVILFTKSKGRMSSRFLS